MTTRACRVLVQVRTVSIRVAIALSARVAHQSMFVVRPARPVMPRVMLTEQGVRISLKGGDILSTPSGTLKSLLNEPYEQNAYIKPKEKLGNVSDKVQSKLSTQHCGNDAIRVSPTGLLSGVFTHSCSNLINEKVATPHNRTAISHNGVMKCKRGRPHTCPGIAQAYTCPSRRRSSTRMSAAKTIVAAKVRRCCQRAGWTEGI